MIEVGLPLKSALFTSQENWKIIRSLPRLSSFSNRAAALLPFDDLCFCITLLSTIMFSVDLTDFLKTYVEEEVKYMCATYQLDDER